MGQWQKLLISRPTPSQSDASLTVAVGGGESLSVATEKNAKIAKLHSMYGVLGMKTWLKLNCLKKFMKRARSKLSISIENFKISPLEKESLKLS